MTRLVLLNGLPGVGKSTLARRWAAERPGTLVCDIDVLRTWVSGWRDSFFGVGGAIRPAAKGLISGYLASGDVVVPQLIANPIELDGFASVATGAGAEFVHVVLRDPAGDPAARFRRRTGTDAWHDEVLALVEEAGGDAVIERHAADLHALVTDRPDALVVPSVEGDEDATYAALVDVVG